MKTQSFRKLSVCMVSLACVGTAWMVNGHEGGGHASVIKHDEVQPFEMNGNQLRGIATLGTGAQQFEVWRSNVAVGSATPRHRHDSEEVSSSSAARDER